MTFLNANKLNQSTQIVFERFPLYKADVTQLKDIPLSSIDDFRYTFGRYLNFTFFDLRKSDSDTDFLLIVDEISGINISLRFFIRKHNEQFLLYPILEKDSFSANKSSFSQFLYADLAKFLPQDEFVHSCFVDINLVLNAQDDALLIVDSDVFLNTLPHYTYPPIYIFAKDDQPFMNNGEYNLRSENTAVSKEQINLLSKVFLSNLTSLDDKTINWISSCPITFITDRLHTEIYNGLYFVDSQDELFLLEVNSNLINEQAILENSGFLNKGKLLRDKNYNSKNDNFPDNLPFPQEETYILDYDVFTHYCNIAMEYKKDKELGELYNFTCDLNFVDLRKKLIDKLELSNKMYNSVLSDINALIDDLENYRA